MFRGEGRGKVRERREQRKGGGGRENRANKIGIPIKVCMSTQLTNRSVANGMVQKSQKGQCSKK